VARSGGKIKNYKCSEYQNTYKLIVILLTWVFKFVPYCRDVECLLLLGAENYGFSNKDEILNVTVVGSCCTKEYQGARFERAEGYNYIPSSNPEESLINCMYEDDSYFVVGFMNNNTYNWIDCHQERVHYICSCYKLPCCAKQSHEEM
jgi:hypothetical protein